MYREIACKTLTGKGKLQQIVHKDIYISDKISKVLGCWIINLAYEVEENHKEIFLKGKYDIQLWYALDNDQKSEVYNETIEFKEKVEMVYRDLKTLDDKIISKVYVNKYPTCSSMELEENKTIHLQIDSLYYVNAFQDAILVVNCSDDYKEDVSLDEEIIMNVNPNYISEKGK